MRKCKVKEQQRHSMVQIRMYSHRQTSKAPLQHSSGCIHCPVCHRLCMVRFACYRTDRANTHSQSRVGSLFSLSLQKCCMFKQAVSPSVLNVISLAALLSLSAALLCSPGICWVCCLYFFFKCCVKIEHLFTLLSTWPVTSNLNYKRRSLDTV